MADKKIVDEFFVAVGVDASALQQGLQEVKGALGSVASEAKKGLSEVGDASAAAAADAAEGFDKSAQAAKELAVASQKAAQDMGDGFDAVTPMLGGLKEQILSVVGVMGLLTGGVAAFTNYLQQSDALGKLSTQLGISEQELDAWGKANEAAGGSADALFESLKAYYDATGRPAEEFFKLGEKIEGMTRRQAQAYLRAQGVAWDAIPVFLNGQREADKLVAKYRETAFTAQDADNARVFRVAWMDFKTAAQDVGNSLVRAVLPAVKSVVEWLAKSVTFVKENARAFGIFAGMLGLAFGIKSLKAIKAAITGIQLFGVSLKSALRPLLVVGLAVAALAVAFDDLATFAEGGNSLFEAMLRDFGLTSDEIEDLRKSINSIIDAFGSFWEAVKPFVGDAISLAFKTLGIVLTTLVGILASVAAAVSKVWDFFKRVGKAITEATGWGDLFKSLAPTVSDALSGAWDAVKNWFKGWVDLIENFIAKPLKKVFSFFTGDDEAEKKSEEGEAKNPVEGFFDDIKNFDAGEAFGSITDGVTEALDNAWAGVVEWFGGWTSLIGEFISNPFKKALGGIFKFFGGKDDDGATISADARGREAVLAKHGLLVGQRPQVTTNATLNLTNNITTRDNPHAVGAAVGGTVGPAFRRSTGLIGQSLSGVNLK